MNVVVAVIVSYREGTLTELPVSLMVARDTGGAYTNISPNGLADVLQRLAVVINDQFERTPHSYLIEYSATQEKSRTPPEVRTRRDDVRLSVIVTQ